MRILYGNKAIHDVASATWAMNPMLTLDLRQTAELTFELPPTHPAYGSIVVGSVDPELQVWDGEECVMKGRAYRSDTVDFSGTIKYKCEGDLAYFDDSVIRPYSTTPDEAPTLAPSTPDGYFSWLVQKHNSQVEATKQFTVGVNQGFMLAGGSNYVLRSDKTYPSARKVIREKMLDALGGFVRTRYSGSTRYIDYLADTDGVATQRIEFGSNLLDFARTVDSGECYSIVVPLGAKDESTGERITIKPLGSGDADSYGRYKKNGDAVESVNAIAELGRKSISVTFEDAETPEALLTRAISWLESQQNLIETIVVKAVDLHLVDPTVKPIRLGDYIRCTSRPHGYDGYMMCSRIEYDIANPGNTVYTLGIEGDGVSGIVAKHAQTLNAGINGAYERADAVDKIAKDAQERADAAKGAADEAQAGADAAKEAADKAKSDAEKAAADALKAAQDALDAKREADEATAKVEVAETDLRVVREAVASAQGAADAASEAAGEAEAKADAASQAAADAKSESQGAFESAASAIATAEAAQAEAAGAKADAGKVRDELAGQIKTVTDTMAADYSKKTDLTQTEARLASEIERSAAGIASTVAETYAKKTDLTSVSADLQTRIEQNADAITSTAKSVTAVDAKANDAASEASAASAAASKAQADAAEAAADAASAQTAADDAAANLAIAEKNLDAVATRVGATEEDVKAAEAAVAAAKGAADAASAAATAAKTDAAAAQATADTAKTAAEAARKAADALGTRVTEAETRIEQNADAITLRATKTEAQGYASAAKSEAVSAAAGDATTKANNALAGAKTYADAQIKVQADRITSNVAETTALGKRMSTVEQTASGLSVRLDTTDKNVAAAQSTANTAKTNAATAQTTANTAKANAATAQSTADTAKANAATAQSTANTAKTNAAAAQSTADTARNEAAAAGKTATNFLEFSSAGLDVGNKTSGKWAGFRTRMAAGSFQVLNAAGTVLASYGDKLVELGKNATDAVIRMCGGKGEIKTETVDGSSTLTVSADSVATRAASGDKAAYFLARILNGVPTATACAYYDGTQSVAAVTVTPNGVSAKGDASFYGSGGQYVGSIKVVAEGTASQVGLDQLVVGNANPSGTLGNARGAAYLYGAGEGYTRLMPSNAADSHNYLNLSAIAGTGTLPAYKELYSNASGTTGTVTLSETAANFSMLEIYFKTNDGNFGCAKVWAPNGKTADLVGVTYNSAESMYTKRRPVLISGTSISNNGYAGEGRVNSNNSCTTSTSAGVILICYVLGWK